VKYLTRLFLFLWKNYFFVSAVEVVWQRVKKLILKLEIKHVVRLFRTLKKEKALFRE